MQPLKFLVPFAYTVLVWWFTTGLIIAVYGRSRRVMRLFFLGATLAFAGAVAGLWLTRDGGTVRDVYIALTCGVVVWGWQTTSYYLGFVTGKPAEPVHAYRTEGWRARFRVALRASFYHELLAALTAAGLALLVWNQSNRWGLWIYLALWLMHASAKLNVFLGVRNFHIEMLPDHMRFMDKLLGKGPNNLLFPISVTVAPSVALFLFFRAGSADPGAAQTVGLVFVGTMIILGLLEHILLVLPLPATLIGWSVQPLPAKEAQPPETSFAALQSAAERAVGD